MELLGGTSTPTLPLTCSTTVLNPNKLPSPRKCIELMPGDRFRERVRNHKFSREVLYDDSSHLVEFSGEMPTCLDRG
jgi:hypothetical protein